MNAVERMRQISLETSMVAVRNIAASGHSGLVTLRLERGVVRKVWIGTSEGLLAWNSGKTLIHVIANVETPLVHG